MKLQMTNTMLTYLCREIDSGRPVAALLRAAEYLTSDSPMWAALTKKAKHHLASPEYQAAEAAISKVLKGATLNMLTDADKRQLGAIQEQSRRRIFVVPQMPLRRAVNQTMRLRVRG